MHILRFSFAAARKLARRRRNAEYVRDDRDGTGCVCRSVSNHSPPTIAHSTRVAPFRGGAAVHLLLLCRGVLKSRRNCAQIMHTYVVDKPIVVRGSEHTMSSWRGRSRAVTEVGTPPLTRAPTVMSSPGGGYAGSPAFDLQTEVSGPFSEAWAGRHDLRISETVSAPDGFNEALGLVDPVQHALAAHRSVSFLDSRRTFRGLVR